MTVFLTVVILTITIFSSLASVKAYTQADVDRQNKIAAQKTAAAAQKVKDAAAMQSKIAQVTSQITETTSSIQLTSTKISDTQSQISNLEKKIQDEQSNLDREQEKMSQIIASWYMEGESGLLEAVISANNLSDVMDKQQYYESLRQQVQSNTEKIQTIQNDLTGQKNALSGQLIALNDLKTSQATQQDTLESDKAYKNRLLANDKSAIVDLNNQAQKATDEANRISAELRKAYCQADGGSWTNGACSNSRLGGPAIHKGNGGVQLNVPYYSQQDPSWASKSMGSSGVSIGAAGCLMTSLAMVASSSYVGQSENPASLVDKSIFQSSGGSAGNFLGFKYAMGRLDGYEQAKGGANLSVIDEQLRNLHPVIVKVYIPGSSLYHWIVITGGDQQHGYSWNDPWPWRNPPIYTNFYNMRTFD